MKKWPVEFVAGLVALALATVGIAHVLIAGGSPWFWPCIGAIAILLACLTWLGGPLIPFRSVWLGRLSAFLMLIVGLVFPLYGIAYLLTTHSAAGTSLPLVVLAALPFNSLGPSLPSRITMRFLLFLSSLFWLSWPFILCALGRRLLTRAPSGAV